MPLSTGKREIVVSLIDEKEIVTNPYFGATVGRMAGRIRGGQATILGKSYQFEQNEGLQTTHGGKVNFSNQFWQVKSHNKNKVVFVFFSKHGENGFPGNIEVEASFSLTSENQLKIEYNANSDQTTLFNPMNHIFFNLDGQSDSSVINHILQIFADSYLPLDKNNLPLEQSPVAGSIFDFRKGKKIKTIFCDNNPQISINEGLNHPFILKNNHPQVSLTSEDRKITVEMTITQEALIVYTTGDSLTGFLTNTGSLAFAGAIALEAQMAPGSENSQDSSKVMIYPGKTYHAETSYQLIF